MRELRVSVAGLTIAFRSSDARVFGSDETFRGFAIGGSDGAVDLDIEVNRAREIGPERDATATFVGDTHEIDETQDPYIWTISQHTDGSESVRVEYDRAQDGSQRAVMLRMRGSEGQMRITDGLPHQELLPFTFPMFNLMMSRLLLRHGGYMIHSSAVRTWGGAGYLFTAVSGTGKSTMADIWVRSGNAELINDDMIAVRREGGDVMMYNIPMTYYKQEPRKSRLTAVFVIRQSQRNEIAELTGAGGIARVMANIVSQPMDIQSVRRLTSAAMGTLGVTKIYDTGFVPDATIVDDIREAVGER